MKRFTVLAGVACLSAAAAAAQAAWHFVISTAPHYPQDVWLTGNGSNDSGWRGGGCICLRHAQGFGPGESVTVLTDVASAGVYGPDGEPMPAFDDNGDPIVYTASSSEFGDLEFTVKPGETFFVIVDGEVVASQLDDFPVGTELDVMFTWDYRLGRDTPTMVAWFPDGSGGWFPFLNEGPMMANVRQRR